MEVLIVSLCKERLHEREFVDPIVNIVKNNKDCLVTHYLDLEEELEIAEKVILCGTSLKDFEYLENLDKFEWLKDFNKPVLGVCAGIQVFGLVFNQKIKSKTQIGLFKERLSKNFLGSKEEINVWHLHQSYMEFDAKWEIICEGNKIPQVVKHKTRPFYGCLFHPEVRNKEIIEGFLKL